MTKSLARLVISIGLLGACGFAGDTGPKTGAVQGMVFTTDANGGRSVVPGLKVSLNGPTPSETSADAEGKFVFSALQPGSYILKSEASGMTATQVVAVTAGAVSAVSLEMKVAVVEQSTTVTASSDAVGTQEPAGTNTVGEQAVKDMPTLNERFEDLLPLIPGVVRGPDGLINMKGARSSQNGSLVNSADVTDPATGSMAINIPIDVVSSVQVLSTPYDPEYGKFTGAVSNVETRY
jgi:hypothetical protein